jgi:hypothetical protein
MFEESHRREEIREEMKKVVKNMLLDNEPIEKIVKYTQLSVEQIESLNNEELDDE